MKVVVSGASGFIGQPLVQQLREHGHEVLALVRGAARAPDERSWDPAAGQLDPAHLAGTDAVINLNGAGIGDHRWTPAYRELVRRSRVDATSTLATALAGGVGPKVLLSGSAIGIYGDTKDQERDETGPTGNGFLADVCRAWEESAEPAVAAGVRVVLLRTGIVLDPTGGALRRQLPIFRAGLGAALGTGRQWLSWISLRDQLAAIRHCLTNALGGPVNLVAPAPVTNKAFTRELGRALHRATLPVPAPGFVLAAALGGFAREGLLAGQRLRPAALLDSGFQFSDPALGPALATMLR